MTLKEELIEKRNMVLSMNHKEIAKEVWEHICLAFRSFTALELVDGETVCVEVEEDKDRLWITKFISNESFLEIDQNDNTYIIIGERNLDNGGAIAIMRCVVEMAKKEGVRTWQIEEDEHKNQENVWCFTIDLIERGKIDINL